LSSPQSQGLVTSSAQVILRHQRRKQYNSKEKPFGFLRDGGRSKTGSSPTLPPAPRAGESDTAKTAPSSTPSASPPSYFPKMLARAHTSASGPMLWSESINRPKEPYAAYRYVVVRSHTPNPSSRQASTSILMWASRSREASSCRSRRTSRRSEAARLPEASNFRRPTLRSLSFDK